MFLVSDVLSVLPSIPFVSSSPQVADPPVLGQPAPKDPKNRLNFPLTPARPLLLVFVRHCGCPFAERDVHSLVHLVLDNPSRFQIPSSPSSSASSSDPSSSTETTPLQFLIVTHSPTDDSRSWFASVLHAAFESYTRSSSSPSSPPPSSDILTPHFALFPDPDLSLPHAYGIGSLPTFSSLFGGSTFSSVGSLKEKGIVNRSTGWGSDRWAGHGGVGIDSEGVVRWFWKGEKADEQGDWEGALKALGV